MKTVLEVRIDSKGSLFPMPKNKEGFLFLYALDKQLTMGLMQRDNTEAYEIFDVMKSTCITVNTLNVMRKRGVSFDNALNYCKVWADTLPWCDLLCFNKKHDYIFKKDLFSNFFMESWAKSQLQQREEGMEKLYNTIITTYITSKPIEDRSPDETMIYQYLDYALQELTASWEDLNLNFIAPIFPVSTKDESKYGSRDHEDIITFNYLPTFELTAVYEQECNGIIHGHFDKKGNFEILDLDTCTCGEAELLGDALDLFADDGESNDIFADLEDVFLDLENNDSLFEYDEDLFSESNTDIFDSSNDFTTSEEDEEIFCVKENHFFN